jgi:hypothetical protein
MKNRYHITLLLLLSCSSNINYIRSGYSGDEVIDKKIIIAPVNLSHYKSSFFSDVKLDEAEKELLDFNQTILDTMVRKFEIYKFRFVVDDFENKRTRAFNELWDTLRINQEIGKNKRKEIDSILLEKQDAIDKLANTKNNNLLNYKEDYLLVYKINYFQDTPEKKASTDLSIALIVILGIATGSGGSGGFQGIAPTGGTGSIQYLLIKKATSEIVLLGEIEGLYKDHYDRNEQVISNLVKRIFVGIDI